MSDLCLLFRRPAGGFFSIEKIFDRLSGEEGWHIPTHKVFLPNYSSSLLKIFRNLAFVRRQDASVYHVTGDVHYAVLGLPRKRVLLTIHDCGYMHKSSGLRRMVFKWLFLDLPVRHCQLVTTISESTRQDILKFTRCPPDKVVVIPNPMVGSIQYVARPFRQRTPVILFVGVTPNKNLGRAIQALKGIDCRLNIIGHLPADMVDMLEENRINYDWRCDLTETELAQQYVDCDMVLFPSVFEGFGLPVIEGQKAGRPVITSNISPMKEVAGDGACLIDPNDTGSIRHGVIRVIEDEPYREKLVQQGFHNIERFSPDEIVRQYQDCYQRLLASQAARRTGRPGGATGSPV